MAGSVGTCSIRARCSMVKAKEGLGGEGEKHAQPQCSMVKTKELGEGAKSRSGGDYSQPHECVLKLEVCLCMSMYVLRFFLGEHHC